MGLEMGSGMGFSLSFLVYKKSNTLGVFPGAILISGKRRNGAGLLGWLVGWLLLSWFFVLTSSYRYPSITIIYPLEIFPSFLVSLASFCR